MQIKVSPRGQVTIPKKLRDALGLRPGMPVEVAINRHGELVIRLARGKALRAPDRFEAARGKADVPWSTPDLMALLRGGLTGPNSFTQG